MSGTLICGKTTGNAVVPVQVNADGTLEMTAEIDSSALAKETTLDSFRTDNASNLGVIATTLDDGTQQAKCMGSEDPNDPAGTQKQIHLDGSGNVLVKEVGTVNVAPSNDVNSGITNDPANSVAVGLRARTDIADAATETFLKCDATGVLQTSGSGGGGSAATNTYSSAAVSVLSPINPGDPPLITPSQRFDLTSVKNIQAITLWTIATNFTDVSKVGLEYSYDGTNYFSNLGSAGSPSWSTTQDLNGNTRVDPVGGINPIYIDQSLFPDQDKAQYFRIVFEHSNQAGADVSIVPIIVFAGI